jgi:hypothetical protein
MPRRQPRPLQDGRRHWRHALTPHPTSRPAPLTSPQQRHPWRHAGTARQLILPSHLGIVRTAIPGWRGQSERLAVASRPRSMQQVIPGLQVLIGRFSPYINPLYASLSLSCCTPPVNRTRNTSASPLAIRLRVLSIFSVSTPAGPYIDIECSRTDSKRIRTHNKDLSNPLFDFSKKRNKRI